MEKPKLTRIYCGNNTLFCWKQILYYTCGQEAVKEMEFKEAWEGEGIFLFCSSVPEDWERLGRRLERFFKAVGENPALVFINGLEGRIQNWEYQIVLTRFNSGGRQIDAGRLAMIGSYGLYTKRGALLCFQEETMEARDVGQAPYELIARGICCPGEQVPLILSLAEGTGAWKFVCTVRQTEDKTVLKQMGAGINYCMAAGKQGEAERIRGYQNRMFMPVIELTKEEKMEGKLTPLSSRGSDSFIRFSEGTGEVPLEGYFLDIYGKHLSIAGVRKDTGFAFCHYPSSMGNADKEWYLSPMGTILLKDKESRTALGLAGTECLVMGNGMQNAELHFHPGYSSFFDGVESTASWVSAQGMVYASQPEQSPWFGKGSGDSWPFLYENLPVSLLRQEDVFPMGIYQGCECFSAGKAEVEKVEWGIAGKRQQLLKSAFIRRKQLQIPWNALETRQFLTAQGLLAGITVCLQEGRCQWEYLGIGNMEMEGQAAGEMPSLSFTKLSYDFQMQLQKSQVMIAVTGQEEMDRLAQIPYGMTKDQYADAIRKYPTASMMALKDMAGTEYGSWTEFCSAAASCLGALEWPKPENEYLKKFCGRFSIEIDGWSFFLNPALWRSGYEDGSDTLMLMKYTTEASIRDLMETKEGVAADLFHRIVADCYDAQGREKEGKKDLLAIIGQREWNGTLFLNVPLLAESIPRELSLLAKDIDMDQFYAEYLSLEAGDCISCQDLLMMKQSSVQAKLNYEKKYDPPIDKEREVLDYCLLFFHVEIADSHIQDFSCMVLLVLNRMFGALLGKAGGDKSNGLELGGSCVRREDGSLGYRFLLTEEGVYSVNYSPVCELGFSEAGFSLEEECGRFLLSGWIKFADQEEADLLCYGAEDSSLVFCGLAVGLAWQDDKKNMWVDTAQFLCRAEDSECRPSSFGSCFPVETGGLCFFETPPKDSGYQNVSTPFAQSVLTGRCLGLSWKLQPGSFGSLTEVLGGGLELLIAWQEEQADESAPGFYVGMKAEKWPDIQGVLQMGFTSVMLTVSEMDDRREYRLNLHGFYLKLLGASLLPGRQDLVLFGASKKEKEAGYYLAVAPQE